MSLKECFVHGNDGRGPMVIEGLLSSVKASLSPRSSDCKITMLLCQALPGDWPLIQRVDNFHQSRVTVQTKDTVQTDCSPCDDAQEPQLLLGNSFYGLEEGRRTLLLTDIIRVVLYFDC